MLSRHVVTSEHAIAESHVAWSPACRRETTAPGKKILHAQTCLVFT